jgi:sulfopyruvate decarboxylase subunit alpha
MMNHKEFCSLLKKFGFNFCTGVPCSILSNIINYMSRSTEFTYIPATREDEAIGLAVGAYMGGKRPAVLMQNSGLGNSINALTSLVLLYQIPLLFIISWRGYQGKDAPEHLLMGKYTLDFLKIMKIPTEIIEKNILEEQVMSASRLMEEQKIPVALILKKDVIE